VHFRGRAFDFEHFEKIKKPIVVEIGPWRIGGFQGRWGAVASSPSPILLVCRRTALSSERPKACRRGSDRSDPQGISRGGTNPSPSCKKEERRGGRALVSEKKRHSVLGRPHGHKIIMARYVFGGKQGLRHNEVGNYTCLRPVMFKPINARVSNFYAGILRTLWFDGLRNVNADSPNADSAADSPNATSGGGHLYDWRLLAR